MAEISPQGYIYGKEPKSRHPFWGGGGGDIDEYVKSLNGTITETEDGKVYKIEATDGDDVVSEVISILVPNPVDVGTYAENVSITSQHENNQTTYTISYHTSDNVDHIAGTVIVPDIPAPPTDYVTSVAIQKVETTTQDTYYFTYYTKDGESHGMGTIVVKKDYVQSVSVTGEEASGVNTITIDVDGDESSFDIPTQYVKNITQSAGEVEDDVYTFTDENGHTTDISAPGQYLQSFTSTVNDTTTGDESYTLGMRGIVSGTPANSSAFTAHLQTPAHNANSKYHIDFTNAAGDTAELEWSEGTSIPDEVYFAESRMYPYWPCIVTARLSTGSPLSSIINDFGDVETPWGSLTINNRSRIQNTNVFVRPQFCFLSTNFDNRLNLSNDGSSISATDTFTFTNASGNTDTISASAKLYLRGAEVTRTGGNDVQLYVNRIHAVMIVIVHNTTISQKLYFPYYFDFTSPSITAQQVVRL